MKGLHHIEIWVPDIDEASGSWGWLLERLGLDLTGEWPGGCTWSAGDAYVTLTTSPNVSTGEHDRRRAGVNHLAFWGGARAEVDTIISDAELRHMGGARCIRTGTRTPGGRITMPGGSRTTRGSRSRSSRMRPRRHHPSDVSSASSSSRRIVESPRALIAGFESS